MKWSSFWIFGTLNYSLIKTNREAVNHVEQFIFKDLLPPVRKQVLEEWNNIAIVGSHLVQRGELSQPEVEAVMN